MRILVGLFLVVFGLTFAVLSPRFARAGAAGSKEIFGTTGGTFMRRWNRVAFVVIGLALAVFGAAYALGFDGF
ncbi:hypothetical protein ACWDNT_04400 [Streptomyces sp. NPDC000963]|uniref:hypothetical protein n=1 Tax=Streptomyces sp. NPDC088752 TaxID=3154963 RepID=UPI0013940E88|nr:hypothetical protein [Streptomyces sp. SID2131]